MAVEIYSDVNKHSPGALNSRVINDAAVLAAVQNLFNTQPYRRLFRPEGFTLDPLLFETNDENAAFTIRSLISRVLAAEPRIQFLFNQSDIRIDPENNAIHVKILFRVKGYGETVFERVGTFRKSQ